jgi:aryl-alcohol dehydrogenase-like predicted oxidoreductase
MKYKLLGNSGLRVSELCLGTMTFGTEWNFGSDKKESRQVFDAFVERGGNFLDTANRYTDGTSETMLGEFLGERRDRFVVATKFTLNMRRGDPNAGGNHRKNLMQSLDASLKRLRTDYIDLYWVHAWDMLTPVEELVRALDDVVRAGKVRYVGVSDFPAWLVAQANTLAALRGWTPFVGLQIEYSLIERTVERELIPMAQHLGLGITPWSPLAGGLLTGKYARPDNDATPGRKEWTEERLTERNVAIVKEVQAVAQQIGRSPAQVALNWLTRQPQVVAPIIGARTVKQLDDNFGCLDFTLSPEQMNRLDEVSKIDLGFPMAFLQRDRLLDIIHGGTYEQISAAA